MPSASSPAEGASLLIHAACGPVRVARGRAGTLEEFLGGESPRGGARELPGLVDRLLEPAGALAEVAVVVGPGSFTGIKVGIAFARGFARARGLPLRGVDGLAALALAGGESEGERWAGVDALRGECFGRPFRVEASGPPEPLEDMRRVPWSELPEDLELVVDPGQAGQAPARALRPEPAAIMAAGLALLAAGGAVEAEPIWTRPSWAQEVAGGSTSKTGAPP